MLMHFHIPYWVPLTFLVLFNNQILWDFICETFKFSISIILSRNSQHSSSFITLKLCIFKIYSIYLIIYLLVSDLFMTKNFGYILVLPLPLVICGILMKQVSLLTLTVISRICRSLFLSHTSLGTTHHGYLPAYVLSIKYTNYSKNLNLFEPVQKIGKGFFMIGF